MKIMLESGSQEIYHNNLDFYLAFEIYKTLKA